MDQPGPGNPAEGRKAAIRKSPAPPSLASGGTAGTSRIPLAMTAPSANDLEDL